MASTFDVAASQKVRSHRLLAGLVIATIFISLAATSAFNRGTVVRPLFKLSDMAGPATESLLEGRGLTVCTDAMGTPGNPICFHAAHMPMTPLVLALGIRLLGNHYLPVAFFKVLLLLFPVELAIWMVWRRSPPDPKQRLATTLLLFAPFVITAFLASMINLAAEEGYSYSFLALAVAILLFAEELNLPLTLLFAITLDCLYLSKSAMVPAVIVLLIGYLLMQRRSGLRLLAVLLVVAAPAGWAVYQHHASGRYTLGTSLDGINLHKGNNAAFLEHYPPPPGDTLDQFDQNLNRGQHFTDEWSFNDYHRDAAISFAARHPGETIRGDLRKLYVLLLSAEKVGSSRVTGATLIWETASLVLFRMMLWAAIAGAFYTVFRPAGEHDQSLRLVGGIFLALVAACALPYVTGFAFTRHASILIYPSALMCCRILMRNNAGSSALTM